MTAFNPPSILFFNGVTFNPEIIEGDTVVSGGGVGDVTLAGNNTFTGINEFTNAAGIKVNDIDTTTITNLNIGKSNANQILLGSAANPIGVTIAGTTNVFADEFVVNEDGGKKYVAVDECFFTTGTGSQATIDTKTAVPLHIAPSTAVEPFAICSGVVIGNSTIPVTVAGNAISLTGATTFSGANIFSSSNNFTSGSIDVTTQSAGNNTTSAASTAFVNNAIAGVSGVSLSANNDFTGVNTFSGGIITSSIEGNNADILIDTVGNGVIISGPLSLDYTFNADYIDSRIDLLYIGSSGFGPTTGVLIGSDTVGVSIGGGGTIVGISNVDTDNLNANSISALNSMSTPLIANAGIITVGDDFDPAWGVDLVGVVTAPTQTAGNNTTRVATTAFVTAAVAAGGGGGVTLGGNNVWTGANSFLAPSTINVATQATTDNSTLAASTAHVRSSFTSFRSTANTWTNTQSFTGATINVPNQTVGNNTTLAASTNFVNAAINALKSASNNWSNSNNFTTGSINVLTQLPGNNTTLAASTVFVNTSITANNTAIKAAANTWSGANNFTTGSINVTTQTAGDSTTLAASTAFVSGAISALSSIYQTAAQVATSISTELTNFLGTPHLWTADQDLHLVEVYVKTQLQSVSSDVAASTSYVGLAVTNSLSANYSYIMTNTNNFTGVNTFTADTFVPTITTGTNTTQAASSAFVNDSITAMKAATNTFSGANTFSGSNTFSGANGFTTGSINVTTQTAGNNTTLAASTAFVTAAISALSTLYQTAAQVTTSINSALTTFRATANTFSANQIFPTIQFSTGTLNQAFRIQHVTDFGFGTVGANATVTTTFTYAALGLTNFTTFISANISNSSGSANGARVIFSINTSSATSFTIVGMNPTGTSAGSSSFSLIVFGR